MSAVKAQTDVSSRPTAARGSAAGGAATHLAEPGRVRARCGRDRARPVRLDHAVAAVSRLQRAVALLAADADPDLRDLRLRGAGQPAARRGRLRRRRPSAGPARRAWRADRRNRPVPARRLGGLAVRGARRSRASPPGRRSAPPAPRCWTCIRAATPPASGSPTVRRRPPGSASASSSHPRWSGSAGNHASCPTPCCSSSPRSRSPAPTGCPSPCSSARASA